MKYLSHLVASILSISVAYSEVGGSLTNDDWPIPIKDDGLTFSTSLYWKNEEAQFVAHYDLYTNREAFVDEANNAIGTRVDELFFGMTGPYGVGVATILQGDLGGETLQRKWHQAIGATDINCAYDGDNTIVGGLWFNRKFWLSDWNEALFLNTDILAHFDGVRGRIGLGVTREVNSKLNITCEVFARGWFEYERYDALEHYHEQAGKVGVRLVAYYKHLSFEYQIAEYDVAGTLGWRF